MNTKSTIALSILLLTAFQSSLAQATPTKGNDVTTSLHALQSDYPVAYRIPVAADIRSTLERIRNYLEAVTPAELYDRVSCAVIR